MIVWSKFSFQLLKKKKKKKSCPYITRKIRNHKFMGDGRNSLHKIINLIDKGQYHFVKGWGCKGYLHKEKWWSYFNVILSLEKLIATSYNCDFFLFAYLSFFFFPIFWYKNLLLSLAKKKYEICHMQRLSDISFRSQKGFIFIVPSKKSSKVDVHEALNPKSSSH